MSVVHNMIILEDICEEMFLTLPTVTSLSGKTTHSIVFGYGNPKALNVFLKQKEKGNSPYPLIWLLYPYEELHTKTKLELEDIVFIFAVKTNSSMQNAERIEETYKKMLIPLYDNFVKLFKKANIINTNNRYKVVKHPNYGSGKKNAGNFIWDALRVTCDFTVLKTCFKPINFN